MREGSGKTVPNDGKVWYNYLAYAEDREGPFDSSLQRGVVETLTFKSASCIEGIMFAIPTMKIKEIAKFWIHYEYAYGALGAPPRIPAGNYKAIDGKAATSKTYQKLYSAEI